MPVYSYHCTACGSDYDIRQSFNDDDLTVCPKCHAEGTVRRILTPTGIIFKGSGFYVTDNSRSKNPAGPASNGNGNGNHQHEHSSNGNGSKKDSAAPSSNGSEAASSSGKTSADSGSGNKAEAKAS